MDNNSPNESALCSNLYILVSSVFNRANTLYKLHGYVSSWERLNVLPCPSKDVLGSLFNMES